MLSRSPMFSAMFGGRGRGRVPLLAEPQAASRQPMPAASMSATASQPIAASGPATMATPAPTGAYKLKPETRGQLVSAVAKLKDPLSGVPSGQVASAIAKGQPPAVDTTEATKAEMEKKAKKLRQQAAQVGVLRNQAVNKPPVLSAPGASTGAAPSTLPSATRLGMVNNRIL